MADQIEYKCPCCAGAIAFDSGLQKMKCPFCDTEFEVETLKKLDEELRAERPDSQQWDTDAGEEWKDGEAEELQEFVCKSCGGEIITEATTAATACPYCGNPVVMTGRLSGSLRPDLVIPFKLDKKAATKKLKEHLCGKRLLPKVFKDENHIEAVKGIYVPFWLIDADADANISYRATKVRCWSDRNFNYTETSFFSVRREGSVGFADVPEDGSAKMPDDLMESIEPYDLKDAVDFQTAYLAGYLADKYDVSAEDSRERAFARVRNSTRSAFRRTVTGYSSVTEQTSSIQLKNGKMKYALLPVWLLQTKWNGTEYLFAMNGQTGKFVGNLPVDKSAKTRWFFGLTAGIGAAVFAVLSLVWLL